MIVFEWKRGSMMTSPVELALCAIDSGIHVRCSRCTIVVLQKNMHGVPIYTRAFSVRDGICMCKDCKQR